MSIFNGLVSKSKEYLDKAKEQRAANKEEIEYYKTEERKQEVREHSHELRNKAVEHNKMKAVEVLNNPHAHLAKKIAAMNTLYKEDKPKSSNAVQDLSNQMYINRYKKDMRIEKNRALKELNNQEKLRKKMESIDKRNTYLERNAMLKAKKDIRNLIQKAKSRSY